MANARFCSWTWVPLVFGALVGQACATPFTLQDYELLLLHQVRVSPGDRASLAVVTQNPAVYGAPIQETVGYVGWLWDWDGSQFASIAIGAAGTPALNDIRAVGSFSAFRLVLANDDEDPWAVRLYADVGGVHYSGSFQTLNPGASRVVVLNFGATLDLAQATDMGFEIQGHFVPGGKPSNPDYWHISVAHAPVPGAFTLTLAGLGVGLRWRRYVR